MQGAGIFGQSSDGTWLCNALPAGLGSRYAVFDKIVPGYYHRRTEAGDLCTSACCNNTAPEHLMFERLIVDDTVHWARNYKVLCLPIVSAL